MLFLLTAAAYGARPTARSHPDRPQRIVVNSDRIASPTEPGVTTLLGALAEAARDPADNLIEFDPGALSSPSVIIQITAPIVVESRSAGHDRIDGAALAGRLTIDSSACPDAGIIVGGDGQLTLARLVVRGGRQRVLLVKQNGRLALNEVAVRGGAGPGLALFGEANASAIDSQLAQNHTHGLELHGQTSATLTNTDLSGNGQSGLAVFDSAEITARDCRLDANGDWNLVQTHDSRAELTRCLLRGARFANADVSGSATLSLNDCTLDHGRRFGIFATGQATLALAQVQLRCQAGRGIELQDQAVLTLDDSRIEASGDYGMILFGQTSVTATKTLITRNGAHGACVRDRASGSFTECRLTANRYSGLGCLDAGVGGKVHVTRCLFQQNGLRPIYRGPLHIEPLVPTPLVIHGRTVTCLAEPEATIELFLDRAGEAAHYLKTIRADRQGRFEVDGREVPDGWTMTATATAGGSTSEFNVLAGTLEQPVLEALIGRTGNLSDLGGEADPATMLRRWKPGTRIALNLQNPPSAAVERYMRFLVERIGDWTGGTVTAGLHLGAGRGDSPSRAAIPIRYVPADSPYLLGRGGVTFMKWDAAGYFLAPMEIIVAVGRDASDTCPRVLAHEVGHTLGLSHCRVGLLSRMQGSIPPSKAFVNDFSPMMTYYDVLALQILHDPQNRSVTTLGELLERGAIPRTGRQVIAGIEDRDLLPSFSPPPNQPHDAAPRQADRP